VASRKGIEPLTPGLGNLCSILLSYRDLTLFYACENASIMKSESAHLRAQNRSRAKTGFEARQI
jgi:hypothetical protein